jgi:ABC-type Mn2+/Zn2+ transport system permease subunit
MTIDLATALHSLAAPWGDPLMRRALLEVVLLGVAGGALGCWVVLYGLSYGSESLSHGLLPGLVLAALAGFPLIAGGAIGIAVAALALWLASRLSALEGDTAVAVVVTALFGAGVLLALSPATPAGIQGLLFGDPLGPSNGDLALAAALAVIVLAALALLHRRLLAVGFDRAAARGLGVSPAAVDAALLLLLALTILVGVQGLGNLLVVAVIVAPGATARLLARRAAPMLALAAVVAAAAGTAGLYLSYYANAAAGACVAGAIVAAYLVAACAAAARGYHRTRWPEASE